MVDLRFTPRGPFSLAASAEFLEGFTPAAYDGAQAGHLHLAFPVEHDWRTVGVCVRQEGEVVLADVVGDADPAAQVERILSLDVDGSGFPAVGERDPVIGGLQRRYPGLRPVTFHSPYEAAAWAVISHRIRMTQAAAIKLSLAERLGETVDLHGERMAAFPAPARLRALDAAKGLTDRKIGHLHAVADAAEAGVLDAARLRALPREQALAELKALPGIGPFSADLVLLRGAGEPDAFSINEPRLSRAMAQRYGLTDPDPERLTVIAERWRPYRTWASVLLRADAATPP
jgi:DNA-3-methyladenine glycosylase II